MKIEIPVSLRINRPVQEVYKAIIDPAQIGHYFCDSATGEWKAGSTVVWKFATEQVSLEVLRINPDRELTFRWKAHFVEERTEVTFAFTPISESVTGVQIRESGWAGPDANSLKSAFDHCCGWENMLCCLKAWLEHGIDLRK